MELDRRELLKTVVGLIGWQFLPTLEEAPIDERDALTEIYLKGKGRGGFGELMVYDGPAPARPEHEPEGRLLAILDFKGYLPSEEDDVARWEGGVITTSNPDHAWCRIMCADGYPLIDCSVKFDGPLIATGDCQVSVPTRKCD